MGKLIADTRILCVWKASEGICGGIVMKEGNVIEVSEVRKSFKVFYDKGRSLKEKVLFKQRNKYEERWVLQGIDFKVSKGETLGLIGRNGCGKSTILKILTRIIYPTEGNVEILGRVSSLIELGAGFHPDLTGRENIFINASIFGLTHDEIERRLGSIIEFSELENFIDNPIRTYSSGMYMRLAFAVAINVSADILLIDEILGVGDVNFQQKCFGKLKEIKNSGTTIVIVSHSMNQLEQICDRGIWIEEGKIVEDGPIKIVVKHYLESMEDERIRKEIKITEKRDLIVPKGGYPAAIRSGTQRISFVETSINSRNEGYTTVKMGETLSLKCTYKSSSGEIPYRLMMSIFRADGVCCYGTELKKGICGEQEESAEIKVKINLFPGEYSIDLELLEEEEICDLVSGNFRFQVEGKSLEDFSWGISRLEVSIPD